MIKFLKVLLLSILTFITILALIWNIAIPEESLLNLINDNAKSSYTHITFEGLKKGLFFNMNSQKVLVFYSSFQEPVLILQDLKVDLNLFSILTFKPTVYFTLNEVDARIFGYLQITGDRSFDVNIENLNIESQKGLKQFNIDGKGIINLNIHGKIDNGEYKLSVEQMSIKPIQISSVLVPFDKFNSIKGIGNFRDKVIYVKSLAFSGTGIQALAKGSITRDKTNITIEIITSKDVPGYTLIDFALNKYKKSDGFYVVPMLSNFTTSTP